MLYRIVRVLKGALKNFANFTGKHLCQIKCERKVYLHPCSLYLHYKRDSCTQLFSSEFWRIFKNIFLLEHFWASVSDFMLDISKSNKYMRVSFLLTFFYRKSKTKQKSSVVLKLGNLRFAWFASAKSQNVREAIHQPAFMGSCLTNSHIC